MLSKAAQFAPFLSSPLFSSGMILQQGQPVKLWGDVQANASLTIKTNWLQAPITIKADNKGHWSAAIEPPPAGGPYKLGLDDTINAIELTDILCGEVWLASGQSNMEMPFDGEIWDNPILNAEEHLRAADCPEIRMFMIDKEARNDPADEISGTWLQSTPETAREFSAVGYFFAQKLYVSLDVPIGIINASMSATAIESWSPRESNKRLGIAYNYGVPDDLEPAFPSGLYNGMIYPLRNFSIKGVIWYQGESNIDWANVYQHQFAEMMTSWRSLFKSQNLPFYFVQLAPFEAEAPQEIAELRDAQLQTYRNVSDCGIVVTTDVGDPIDVHPTNKAPVGKRLALWALAKTYGETGLVYSGPIPIKARQDGTQIVVSFEPDSIGGGLLLIQTESPQFELKDDLGEWQPAQCRIADNHIIVFSNSISTANELRYAWKNFPETALTNKEGLPASPFKLQVSR